MLSLSHMPVLADTEKNYYQHQRPVSCLKDFVSVIATVFKVPTEHILKDF